MSLPTPKDLQKAWDELKEIHCEYLAIYKVKLPSAKHYSKMNKSLWLSVLFYYKNKEVHKDIISRIVQRDIPNSATDQQVRHLKRDGWNIGKKSGVHKLNPYKPSDEFITHRTRQRERLKASNFKEIEEVFGNRCATCGARKGQPDPRYGSNNVILQQGHQNPHKSGEPQNIIPQCQFCNRAYKNDFVFDNKGRVKAVANINPVKRASKLVQRKIFEWLSEKFDSSTKEK